MVVDQGVTGRCPSDPGCQPSASAPDGSSQSGIPNAIFVVATSLHKSGPLSAITSMTLSWRYGVTRDEAIGSALERAKRDKPDFTIVDYLVEEIPLLGMPAQAIDARSAATAKTDAVEDESAVGNADAPNTSRGPSA